MERDEAITLLPVAYQWALRLTAEGRSTDEIAERLGIESCSVPHLVDLAEAKLARLTAAAAGEGS